jgi:eukaryotic-like serine/threonine-protein kinase
MTQARILNNRYEIQSKLGDGGMATVYKALDLKLNRMVAVKILRDSYASDPQFLVRFEREAKQAANLNHPNIVRVYDVGDDGDVHYIVMEYIEGSNLKETIIRSAPFPISQALEIGAQICDAIAYSHSMGLIHRDIKPQNILMDKDGRVRVTDFGIAKSNTASTLTEAGITLGTVHYFSPEQAKGQPVLPQSDIYSIGVVLFEMLTGRIPFDSDNPVALALKHIEETPPSLRRLNPNIPPVVEQIVLRALAKDPSQRFVSADQFSKALRNLEFQADAGTQVMQSPSPQPSSRSSVVPPPAGQYRSVVPPPTGYTGVDDANQPYYPSVRSAPPRQTDPQAYPVRREGGPNYYDARTGSGAYRGREEIEEDDREYEDVPRRQGSGCLPWFVGGAAFIMIIALVVTLLLVVPELTKPQAIPTAGPTLPPATTAAAQKVKVPTLTGKTQQEAEAALKDAKLQVGDTRQDTNPNVDTGKVISTDPAAGQSVDINSKVNLVISKGKETAPLYDYARTSPDDAEAQLKTLGFQVQRAEEYSDTIQQGAVIRTDPKGGDNITVAKGSTIKLFISKGPQPPPTATAVPPTPTTVPATPTKAATPTPQLIAVPGVNGKKLAEGQQLLQNAGFKVKVVEWDETDLNQQFSGAELTEALKTYATLSKGDILGTDPPGGTLRAKGSEVLLAIKK